VSVQLFEDNTAKNILDENGGINWETFWNVSGDVSGIYEQLLKDVSGIDEQLLKNRAD
jgi:hypothetical protein